MMNCNVSIEKGSEFVRTLYEHQTLIGRKFQNHFAETVLEALRSGIDENTLIDLCVACLEPEGIRMPWGKWVKP